MARNALSIREMGEKVCWMLVQQAIGVKDPRALSDYMSGRVAVLLFARASLPERLCATAAVRQMGGTTIYQGMDGGQWRRDVSSFQSHLFPILGYYLDCLYVYGFPTSRPEAAGVTASFPMINAGCGDGHPAHALADFACMLRVAKKIDGVSCAWVGSANGTLYSLLELAAWFPFKLSISLPPDESRDRVARHASEVGVNIRIVEKPVDAVAGASFVFAGRRPEKYGEDNREWVITPALMDKADANVRLLLSATPIRAIHIEPDVFSGKRSMLVRQAEYRLCIHKRILHWVFSGEE